MTALQWLRNNGGTLAIVAYVTLTLIGYSVRRLPKEQQAALTLTHPRFVAFAYFCGSIAGQLLTLAESFVPMLTGKPLPRFKRMVEDATPTEPSLPPTEDSKP